MIVFFDADGTLLDIKQGVPDSAKDAIKKSLNLSHLKDKDYRLLASFYFEKMLATKIKPYIGNGIFYHSKKETSVPCLPFLINRNIHLPIHFEQSIDDLLLALNSNALSL